MFRKRRAAFIALGIAAGGLLILRLCLPFLIERQINGVLSNLEGYEGRVNDVDLAVLAGTVRLEGVSLDSRENPGGIAVHVKRLEGSVEWLRLFRGRVAARVRIIEPAVHMVSVGPKPPPPAAPPAPPAPKEPPVDWRRTVRDLPLIVIEKITVENGKFLYEDKAEQPAWRLGLPRVDAKVENLSNRPPGSDDSMLSASLDAVTSGNGTLTVRLGGEPLRESPTFDVNAKLEHVELKALNDLFRRAVSMDVQGGLLDVYAEVAAAEGRFQGYVKPMLKELNVVSLKKEKLSIRTAAEALIDGIVNIFQNPKTERAATRVEFEGRFDAPDVSPWQAVSLALRNAFIDALSARMEGKIDLKDVQKD